MIPISKPLLGPEEEAAVIQVMRSGHLAQGRSTEAFEAAFAAATGARYAIATSSGTTALHLALLAHGIGPGDEVIVSPLSFIATANAIVHAGATPIFADVDDTLNLDPAAAEAMIGPRTRAVMPVHLHGGPADLDALCELACRRGLVLIQDACQAIAATVGGRPLGAYGTAVYSLYATKNITTGEGGMVTTDDEQVAATVRSLRHQAYTDQPYLHDRVGFNFRMTEIQAAIGLVQLGRLEELTERRIANAAYYDATICDDRFRRPRRLPGARHVFHQYVLRTAPPYPRDYVRAGLEAAGIASAVHYPVPAHLQPAYRDYPGAPCPQAELAARDMLSIPVHPGLSQTDLQLVGEALNSLGPAPGQSAG